LVIIGEPAIIEEAFTLYNEEKYAEASILLTGAENEYPAWANRIFEIQMDLAALQGNLEQAEDILEKAMDQGCFFSKISLREDGDVKELQGRQRFEILVEKSLNMLAKKQKITHSQLILKEPNTYNGDLVMALHGNISNSEVFSPYWSAFVDRGCLVALPQSSQLIGKKLFVWNDMDKADQELRQQYSKLVSRFAINAARTIISGFSKGGNQAIRAVLTGVIPARGFIAVTPFVGKVELWKPLLDANREHKISGVFILGGKDTDCTPGALELYELMVKNGFDCILKSFPEMGHEFPDWYDDVLETSAAFFLK
jgi:predicted esterase